MVSGGRGGTYPLQWLPTMPPSLHPELGAAFEALLQRADPLLLAERDPISLPRRYTLPQDIEIAGLLASMMAFGRVELFLPVVRDLLDLMDSRGGPAAFVKRLDPTRDSTLLDGFQYRWVRGHDLFDLLRVLQASYQRHESLQALFAIGWRQGDQDLRTALTFFVDDLLLTARALLAPAELSHGLRSLLPSPRQGSACKRWNLFLRWMVRREAPDLGLWSVMPPSALMIPLDTHVLRISGKLGLCRPELQSSNWLVAAEITSSLRQLDPADPIRYDLALAHLGISGFCVRARRSCQDCPLAGCCASAQAMELSS